MKKKYNMKNLKKKNIFSYFIVLSTFIGMLYSCANDNDSSESNTLVVNSVSLAQEGDLIPIKQGYANNMYIIQGSGFTTVEKIYFNDTETYFNPTLVTDKTIFVTIDESTPYENSSNELRIETKIGTVIYDFVVAPPGPQLTKGFNPVNANPDDIITIYGNFFLDPEVAFGDIQATVVSNTLTEIKVKVPEGADKQYVTVTTISGSVTSTYALGTAIYDDVFYDGWDVESWNGHEYVTDGKAQQGLTYYKKSINAWDNIQGNWSWYTDISDYAGIRIALKADEPGELQFIFNGNWSTPPSISVTTEWKEYYIPWSDLANPSTIQNISFKNNSGSTNVFYFDNIGYYLK
jgi:hypothetical protein